MWHKRDRRDFMKFLFPKYLVLLVMLPLITGLLIDHELVHPISFLVNLIWMLPFTFPYYIFRKQLIYSIATIYYFSIGFFEIGHWLILDGPLTISSLLNFFNSNYEEVVAFIELKFDAKILLLFLYILLFVVAIRNPPKVQWYRLRIKMLALIVMMFTTLGIILFNFFPKTQLIPQVAKVFYATTVELKHYNLAIADNQLQVVDAVVYPEGEGQTFVLIIGESCSRNHMSLYGNEANTNPRLKKRTDLLAFTDVVSAHTYTTLSIPMILSNMNLENNIEFASSIDLLDVFHSAGFKTYWISNQSQIGIWDNVVSSIASKADVSRFVNISGNSSQEAILSKSHDELLFEPFLEALEAKEANKFIVLHLMGSHNTYSKRYPDKFDRFQGEGTKEKLIAEYRNSVLYNDFVVDSLLNILKERSSKSRRSASAIYVSDHGENVFDEQDKVGHDYARVIPGANVEIPFVVWMSDKFISSFRSKAEIIKGNLARPFVSDDLFHSVLDINHIKVPFFEQRRSIFSPNYNKDRERILADGYNYDNR